jgi:hypothetical protein
LLQLPNPRILKSKTHGPIAAEFNRWSQSWPDLDHKFRDAFNRLGRLRPSARYPDRQLSLSADEGADMLAVVEDAYAQITKTAPRRYSVDLG